MITIYKWHTKLLLFFCLVTMHLHNFSTDILRGNTETANESFTFSLQEHVQNRAANNFYVGAQPGQEGTNTTQEFALASITRNSNQFQGLTPKQVTLNGQPEQKNPLFDQSITSLALLESDNRGTTGIDEVPAVVIPSQPATIYFFIDAIITQLTSLRSVSNVPDVTGAITAGIIDLAATESQVFAAVKPQGGEFGDNNSGVALVIHGFIEVQEGEQKKIGSSVFSC